jgi:adenosylcobyric acid synthase
VRFVEHADELESADLVVLPGTKSTLADLRWLRASGLAAAIVSRVARGGAVLGICGGCQMLGMTIDDPHGIESDERFAEGLGLLAFKTRFGTEKRTSQVRARAPRGESFLAADGDLFGYEIHMGRLEGATGAFVVTERNGQPDDDLDGAVAPSVVGTMIHGLFDNRSLRRAMVDRLRARKGLTALPDGENAKLGDEYDRLAEVVRSNVDLGLLFSLVGR